MKVKSSQHCNFVSEFIHRLISRSDPEIAELFHYAMWFAKRYAVGYELDGPLYLVLDNSVIQAFKHRGSQPKRGLHSLAYVAFCRFVSGWSDRPSYLALSPVAIYEHLGRRSVDTVWHAWAALSELERLLADTKLPVTGLGFASPEELFVKLRDIEADDQFLTQYMKGLDEANWRTDLRAPIGVKIPFAIAYDTIPDNLPLRYFDPWYVKLVLSGRVEKRIIEQSQHDPQAQPISSGDLPKALAKLNKVNKRGLLIGLGDIDMLQICDVSRQYQHKPGYVLIGQTLDRGLAEVLSQRHVYSVGAGVQGGDPQGSERTKEMVALMFSNPFAEQDERAHRIRPKLAQFLEALAEASHAVQSARAS